MVTRVLADANVLFSRTLRDWLFLLKIESNAGMFTVATTVDIVAEAVARRRDRYPELPGRAITRMQDLILESVDERIDDFAIDGSWVGADRGDAHVDAAARAAGIDILVSCDGGWDALSDEDSDALPYDVLHPDEFFCLVDDADRGTVARTVLRQLRHWMSVRGEADLPATLRAAGCPEFAERVRCHLQEIDLAEL